MSDDNKAKVEAPKVEEEVYPKAVYANDKSAKKGEQKLKGTFLGNAKNAEEEKELLAAKTWK